MCCQGNGNATLFDLCTCVLHMQMLREAKEKAESMARYRQEEVGDMATTADVFKCFFPFHQSLLSCLTTGGRSQLVSVLRRVPRYTFRRAIILCLFSLAPFNFFVCCFLCVIESSHFLYRFGSLGSTGAPVKGVCNKGG